MVSCYKLGLFEYKLGNGDPAIAPPARGSFILASLDDVIAFAAFAVTTLPSPNSSLYRAGTESRTTRLSLWNSVCQDWAETQNNLSSALSDQAARTEGAKNVELLIQAAAAIRSCLEIYTAETFPFYHERAQEQLKKCERLLTQAKHQNQ